MITEVLTFQADPDPCSVLGCAMQTEPIETCRDHRCPHRHHRERVEDRQRRDLADARAKEAD
jgi:hypothetical protein